VTLVAGGRDRDGASRPDNGAASAQHDLVDPQMLLERARGGRRPTPGDGAVWGAIRRAGLATGPEAGTTWLREFAFPAVIARIPVARRRVADIAQTCGLAGPALFDFLLAVGEALDNAVSHGSPRGQRDEVRVRVGVIGKSVAVEVRDHGKGLGRGPAAPPEVLSPTGRGIILMRQLADGVWFDSGAGGTTVRLVRSPFS
jgi:serine/threonine-protein kinase RsbW